MRVWANAWDVFFHAPSRGGRGRWADVGFVVCFRWRGFFRLFFFVFFFRFFFFFERTRPAANMRQPLALFTPLLLKYTSGYGVGTQQAGSNYSN